MQIGEKTRQSNAKNIICIANANWEKKTCQIDAKNIKNLHCQCKKYKKFALPMQIGKKNLSNRCKKYKKLALPTQTF